MLPAPLLLAAVLTAPLLTSGAPTPVPTPAQEAGERAPRSHPDHDDVVATVDRLKRALRHSDEDALADALDVGAVAAAAVDFADINPLERMVVRLTLRKELAATLVEEEPWDRAQILAIESVENGERTLVTLRLRYDEGFSTYMNYWLARDGGRLVIQDSEDLETGLRLSHAMGAAIATSLDGGSAALAAFGQAAHQEATLLFEGDTWTLDELLDSYDPEELPRDLRATHWLMRAGSYEYQERHRDALDALMRAARVRPGMAIVSYSRASNHLALGNYEAAQRHAREYATSLAEDAQILAILGGALTGLGRLDEAKDVLERGLADDPNSADCLIALAEILPADASDVIARHFLAMDDPAEQMDWVAGALVSPEHLEAVVDALESIAPEDPNVGFYRAEALLLRAEYDDATGVLIETLPRVRDEDERFYYLDLLAEAAAAAGTPLVAYEAARGRGEQREIFELLGDYLLEEDGVDALDELVRVHSVKHADDLWLPYYAASVAELREDYETACAEYWKGYEKSRSTSDDEPFRETYRWGWVDTMYTLGRAVEAYSKAEPKDETYIQLRDRALWSEDGATLLALVAKRSEDAKRPRGQRDLELTRGVGEFFSGDAAKAVATLEPHAERPTSDEELAWYVEDALIRSALRSGRFDLALARAQVQSLDGDPLYEAVVYAVRGERRDARRAERKLEECLDLWYSVDDFIFDPDLGPALKGPEFAEFREAYWDWFDPEGTFQTSGYIEFEYGADESE